MSTTSNIRNAVAYGMGKNSIIFKIVTRNLLQRGAKLEWLSVFPAEEEILFPPLTYLQPTGRIQVIEIHKCTFSIVEVVPILA